MENNKLSRRGFLKSSAVAGLCGAIGTTGAAAALTSCGGGEKGPKYVALKKVGEYYVPELPDMAADGKELKAGVIGCGGRGSGAVFNFLDAAKGVTIVAIADLFQDKVDDLKKKLQEKNNIAIAPEKCFVGLEAYKQVIDCPEVDVVIVATPPVFRPVHFQYAVEKGKHAFLEKPICVDPVGYRTIMAASKQAAAKNLCVVTGTQRHHQRPYVESYKKIMEGFIGEITGGCVYWNSSVPWYKTREAGWSDTVAMIKDWVNWKWLSGDHIVEQHVHNIDVFTWFSGQKPVKANGFGSRLRRFTGDQYDNFSIDFTMENGIHLHSMCRQIEDCKDNVSEFVQGSKGSWSSEGGEFVIKDLAGNEIWKYDKDAEKKQYKQTNPYVLEHVNWINSIRGNKPIMQTEETAISNMAAIMGRESSYNGQEVTWESMTASPLDLTPENLSLDGKMDMSKYTVPVPGKSNERKEDPAKPKAKA